MSYFMNSGIYFYSVKRVKIIFSMIVIPVKRDPLDHKYLISLLGDVTDATALI
jgi:hypothetical protein